MHYEQHPRYISDYELFHIFLLIYQSILRLYSSWYEPEVKLRLNSAESSFILIH
jgi:hypothetical protein